RGPRDAHGSARTHRGRVPALHRVGEGADQGDGGPSGLQAVGRVPLHREGHAGAAGRRGPRFGPGHLDPAHLLGEAHSVADEYRVTVANRSRVGVLARSVVGELEVQPVPVLVNLVGGHCYRSPPMSRDSISDRSALVEASRRSLRVDSVSPRPEVSRFTSPFSDSRRSFFAYSRSFWISA